MKNTNTGGPAFPIPLQNGQSWQGMAPCDGMTLRDYFAAKAMQALLHPDCPLNALLDVPESSYKLADAMLKARAATESTADILALPVKGEAT